MLIFTSELFDAWGTGTLETDVDWSSRVGRMEAKGCAKAAEWKEARRYFYWALRARVACSSTLAKIASVIPSSAIAERQKVLDSLLGDVDRASHRAVAETLEGVDLTPTLAQLKAEEVSRQMLELVLSDRKAALEGFARSIESLSAEEKGRLLKLVQATSTGMSRSSS